MNDAIGGATSGTLNLTQTAIGGKAAKAMDAAELVAMHQAHLLELTLTGPQIIILVPMQRAGEAGLRLSMVALEVAQAQRLTRQRPTAV